MTLIQTRLVLSSTMLKPNAFTLPFTPYPSPPNPLLCMHHININIKNTPTQPLSPHPIIHMMLRHRTTLADQRPQQRGAIDFGPYAPVVAGF